LIWEGKLVRMTIYLPDRLAEEVKEHDDLNVSAVCQLALRRELTRRKELAKLDEGMERVVVFDDQLGSEVAFVGRELYYNNRPYEVTAYLTRRHRIAIHNHTQQALNQFDSFDDLAADPGWRDGDPMLVAAVAAALGEEHVIELDI
jgi:post-segregation antitoxin (ccd killing protein)